MKIGIYYILNNVSKRVYVGSSKQIEKRLGQHKTDLIKNQHCNIHLQRAWHKYPEDVFEFGVLELTAKKDLLLIEQEYLDVNDNGYNIAPAKGGDCISNHPDNAAIRKRISRGVRKRNASMSQEERNEKWSRPGETNPNWRDGGVSFKICPECKINKISAKSLHCGKCRDRTGEKNPFYNKHHTEETKQHLREMQLGEKAWIYGIDPAELPYTKQYKITYSDGSTKEVAGLKIIAEEFNVSIPCVHATIGRIAEGKIPTRGKFAGIYITAQ